MLSWRWPENEVIDAVKRKAQQALSQSSNLARTAITTTILIAWLVTGDLEVGLAVGGIEGVAKPALYYFHERAWSRLSFGTMQTASE